MLITNDSIMNILKFVQYAVVVNWLHKPSSFAHRTRPSSATVGIQAGAWWWNGLVIHTQANIVTNSLGATDWCCMQQLPYSGKLSREQTFVNCVVLWLFAKVFSTKFWGVASFGTAKASNPWNFSLRNHLFRQFTEVFSLESFPLYSRCRVWGIYTV